MTATNAKALEEKRQQQQLAAMEAAMLEDAGAGLEEADSESFAIPFLKLLQKMSPEVDEADASYVQGAKPGLFFNSASGELLGNVVEVIPVHFQRRYLHWRDRDEGGGYLGAITPAEAAEADVKPDDRGRLVFDDGSYLSDTREHYCLMLREGAEPEPVVVALTSTQIKKSKRWMNAMQAVKIKAKDGRLLTAPTFSRIYAISTVPEKNDQGSWHGWKIEPKGQVTDAQVYALAKSFREAVLSGAAKAAEPAEEFTEQPVAEDDVAF